MTWAAHAASLTLKWPKMHDVGHGMGPTMIVS